MAVRAVVFDVGGVLEYTPALGTQAAWEARPEEMVFLDDVPAAVEAAAELGIRAVLFRNTAQAVADIDALVAGGP